jgi:hypothetical protein
MKRRRKHVISRATEAANRAAIQLMRGKRLEVEGKTRGLVFYLGSSSANRRDPFWLEHPGGRTYYERPEHAVEKLLPHVGTEAIERAKVHES